MTLKNWVTTVGGIMGVLGGLPLAVQYARIDAPLWWNHCQFPLFLCGLIGVGLVGYAAKGKDEHSTLPQVAESTKEVEKIEEVKAEQVAPDTLPPKP